MILRKAIARAGLAAAFVVLLVSLGAVTPVAAAGLDVPVPFARVPSVTAKVVTGEAHSCLLYPTGKVKCWGKNDVGQLGLGDADDRGDQPGQMGDQLAYVNLGVEAIAIDITAGANQTCVLLDDGAVKCWGKNDVGQLGYAYGNADPRGDAGDEMGDGLQAAALDPERTAIAVAAGAHHTCAILDDHNVRCWGGNDFGQLGRADTDPFDDVALGDGRTASAIAAGGAHTCAILDDGSIKCWGENEWGQLGRWYGDTQPRGDAANEMGDALLTVDLDTDADAVAIAAGGIHTCAVLGDGAVMCWGGNFEGQLGLGDPDNRGDEEGDMGALLLPVAVGTTAAAIDVAAGEYHTCALFGDGQVKCWGKNEDGQLGLGDTSRRGTFSHHMGEALLPVELGNGRTAIGVSAGQEHTCAVLFDGAVKCWGNKSDGRVGILPYPDIREGDQANEMGDNLVAVDLGQRERIGPEIAAGHEHSCAVREDGSVRCWGDNGHGQLGLGHRITRGDGHGEMGSNLPVVDLGSGLTARQVVAGAGHTCALLVDGRVKCWGRNDAGLLGLGDDADRGDEPGEMGDALPFVDLGPGVVVTAIAAGQGHTCAVRDDGWINCWGDNAYGQLGLAGNQPRGDLAGEMGEDLAELDLGDDVIPVAITAGNLHTCVLFEGGGVKCWGHNNNGQLGLGEPDPRGLDPARMGGNLPFVVLGEGRTARAIAAGAWHTCALLDNDTVKCWGQNHYGQLGHWYGDQEPRGDGTDEMGEDLQPVDLGTATTPVAIAAGDHHTCARLKDGRVKCWGQNGRGQLGLGDTGNRGDGAGEMGDALPAARLAAGVTATDIVAGKGYSCALLEDSRAKCWGWNRGGRMGLGDADDRGGDPAQMGDALPVVDLSDRLDVLKIAAGMKHTCALLMGGHVKCWGANHFGQLGRGDTDPRGDGTGETVADLEPVDLGIGRYAVDLAAGVNHTCALLEDGAVKCWGTSVFGELGRWYGEATPRGDEKFEMGDALQPVDLGSDANDPEVDAKAVGIAAGWHHACALLDDGRVKCWGLNDDGQLGIGATDRRGDEFDDMGDALPHVALGMDVAAVAVTAGWYHTCALLQDGGVKCWGGNDDGQLGLGEPGPRGHDPSGMGDALARVDLGTGLLGADRKALALAAGANHTCAFLDDGFVTCWGAHNHGQLGHWYQGAASRGTSADEMGDALARVAFGLGNPTTRHLAAGASHTCAVLDDGKVRCWGYNLSGQLGLGDPHSRGDDDNEMGDALGAVPLNGDAIAIGVWPGMHHTCALLQDGCLKCWGDNGFGQLGLGDKEDRGSQENDMAGLACVAVTTVDRDRDGLLDAWEEHGIDVNKDGVVDLDLPALGADPYRKDIFVELDHMPGFALNQSALDAVVDAFAAAPVANRGIRLHIETGGTIAAVSPLSLEQAYATKPDHFGSDADRADPHRLEARRRAYHYGAVVNQLDGSGYDQYPENTIIQDNYTHWTGISEPFGDDFIVALGNLNLPSRLQDDHQAPLFMHELGHNLGLDHGGPIPPGRASMSAEQLKEDNCKPNYLSIMNYTFLYPDLVADRPLDYSRSELAPLDETALVEKDGVQGSTPPRLRTTYAGADEPIVTGVPVHWNDDDDTEDTVSLNLNAVNTEGCRSTEPTILTGYDDWANLKLNFRDSVGYYTVGAPWDTPSETPLDPIPQELTTQGLQSRIPLSEIWRIRPVKLTAKAESNTRIRLQWQPGALDEPRIVGFRIERHSGSGTGREMRVTEIGPQEMAFIDDGLVPGTTYEYAVSTVTRRGLVSLPSDPAVATTGPRIPLYVVLLAVAGIAALAIAGVVVLRRRVAV